MDTTIQTLQTLSGASVRLTTHYMWRGEEKVPVREAIEVVAHRLNMVSDTVRETSTDRGDLVRWREVHAADSSTSVRLLLFSSAEDAQ